MNEPLYSAQFVSGLFDEMAATYGLMNYVSSFGFCARWRKACVRAAELRPTDTAYDLMSGMGECWHLIARGVGDGGRIVGVDFSPTMVAQSETQAERLRPLAIEIREEDFLANALPDASADAVVSAFGLKTFSPEQQTQAAREIRRILAPGGRFSLVEIATPPSPALRVPYHLYLRHVIPLLGRLFLGDPDTYRMLGIYTERFDPTHMARCLVDAGLLVDHHPLFLGCASLFVGTRPVE